MATVSSGLPRLCDGVVLLRPFADEDAPALVTIWRDPAIRAHNDVPEPSEIAALEWVRRSAARADAAEAWEWAVVDHATNELAGRLALKDIDWVNRRAVVALWIAPCWRGRRLAARSLRVAAAHAFAHGLVRLHAECEADNEPSFRCLIAAGMRYEGRLRDYFVSAAGTPVDAHVFGMLPTDLAAARDP